MSGRKIIQGLQEAVAHARGDRSAARVRVVRVPDLINVRAIRERLEMSQEEFAIRYGFSLGSLRNWEQRRRFPDGAARVLLRVIDKEGDAVERALAAV
jgi:putative transcriptional regulator